MKDGKKYYIDQQQINVYNNNQLIKKVAVTGLSKPLPYYLRGVDFTEQMMNLIDDQNAMATAHDALEVNRVISKILNP